MGHRFSQPPIGDAAPTAGGRQQAALPTATGCGAAAIDRPLGDQRIGYSLAGPLVVGDIFDLDLKAAVPVLHEMDRVADRSSVVS